LKKPQALALRLAGFENGWLMKLNPTPVGKIKKVAIELERRFQRTEVIRKFGEVPGDLSAFAKSKSGPSLALS
jgi:hypothetical protein